VSANISSLQLHPDRQQPDIYHCKHSAKLFNSSEKEKENISTYAARTGA